MYEVRFHGRGGQGAVMAAQTLAEAAVIEGNYAVAFPFFGAERRGAPVLAFTRIDSKKIYSKTQVYAPDCVVVLDDSLLDTIDVVAGLKPEGTVVINSKEEPDDIDLGVSVRTAAVDATSVALEILKAPITNTAILGAFAKTTGIVRLDSLEDAIGTRFGEKLGKKTGERNALAARTAFERTVTGRSRGVKKLEPKKQWLPTYQELPAGGALIEGKTEAGLIGPGSFIENKVMGWATFRPLRDKEKCTMCLLCWFYCPEGTIVRISDRGDLMTNYDYCKGCGVCANECPVDAIKMLRARV
ncbi:MAG: pyruvate ferredoxin oxidoreductase subunit gamma [Candidatus Methanoperedens sp.]|nr:pyruvate ferredoxin oxidoreductase subunit gamma [Candidatus Methanoperedens sp.]MCZ7358463.1 pyruvate ferredoxin oxidoreductase subunit gamma [Candidatus Methanoperedens sp.]HLB69970.1 pyruvate ferredoxin oxidoreductase subunit gamma [Candidatus Methanoperedens sp.]